MKAVVYKQARDVRVESVDDASLAAATDVLLRVTSTAICGTDLHIYEGRMGDASGMVIGPRAGGRGRRGGELACSTGQVGNLAQSRCS